MLVGGGVVIDVGGVEGRVRGREGCKAIHVVVDVDVLANMRELKLLKNVGF